MSSSIEEEDVRAVLVVGGVTGKNKYLRHSGGFCLVMTAPNLSKNPWIRVYHHHKKFETGAIIRIRRKVPVPLNGDDPNYYWDLIEDD